MGLQKSDQTKGGVGKVEVEEAHQVYLITVNFKYKTRYEKAIEHSPGPAYSRERGML